ncbi:MAG: hypothetical protein QM724_06460 [Flavobacteriales bacterium]
MRRVVPFVILSVWALAAHAQPGAMPLEADIFHVALTEAEDEGAVIAGYDALAPALGGDSIRLCGGHGCSGWVEDRYPDGRLRHRGYYRGGHLLTFKNYHPNGQLEREFHAQGDAHGTLHTFHLSGTPRSETEFVEKRPVVHTEHYTDGRVRGQEEHRCSGRKPW